MSVLDRKGARPLLLAKLRPVLYAGRCRVALPALDRTLAGRAVVELLAHYRSAELDVSIRPPGIGGAPISARVPMSNLEDYFARGGDGVARSGDGAVLDIPDVEDLHVVGFTAYYSRRELEVSIRRARMPKCRDIERVSLEGLPEFFRWCSRATQIYCDRAQMYGLDAEDLADVDVRGIAVDADVDADALQQELQ